jgi:predicted  nucleic acid-binding Zn-ribbon protein
MADVFREIHRLRRRARDLQEQVDRIPRQVKARQAVIERHQEKQKAEQDAIKKLKLAILEKEATLKAVHAQIAKYEKQFNEAGSEKEFDALKHEIEHARQNYDQVEAEIFAALEESEERAGKLPELVQAIEMARTALAEFEQAAVGQRAELEQELSEVQESLRQREETISPASRVEYDRIINALGPDALARAEGRVCTGCSMEMTPQNYQDLLVGRFVVCRSCERILYLASD